MAATTIIDVEDTIDKTKINSELCNGSSLDLSRYS